MDKICLIGDSIRMGYQNILKNMIKDKYDVIFDEVDNGRFVQYELWQLNQLLGKYGPFKIVVFNSGYWDMNRESPMEEGLNPLPIYLEGLKRIVDLIRSTGGIPIFVTTPPIYDAGKSKDNTGTNAALTYKNEWVIEYNDAAKSLMEKEEVEIVDIYPVLLKGDKYYKCPDMLHLTYEGYKIMSDMIKESIEKHI